MPCRQAYRHCVQNAEFHGISVSVFANPHSSSDEVLHHAANHRRITGNPEVRLRNFRIADKPDLSQPKAFLGACEVRGLSVRRLFVAG